MRTCRKIILVAAAALLAANGFCGVGATQAWVTNYVASVLTGWQRLPMEYSVTNGVASMSYGGLRMVVEEATVRGVAIIRDTASSRAQGWTNEMVFALATTNTLPAEYRHHGKSIFATATNMYCDVGGVHYSSVLVAGSTWLADATGTNRFCKLADTWLQPHLANELWGD